MRRLRLSEGRARIVESSLWLLGERVVSLAVAFVIGVIVANHLGVQDFGRLMFALALVSLVATFTSGGLSGLVVRDLVRRPEERHQILGTVFVVRMAAGLVALVALVIVTAVVNAGKPGDWLLVFVIAAGFCFNATDAADFWFQAQTKLRYTSYARLAGSFGGSALRLLMVLLDAPLVAFAVAVALEQVIVSGVLVAAYVRLEGSVRRWRHEGPRARRYLKESWPLMLSGVANTLNLRVDQVLLGALASASAVGTYAIAARLSEVWYFVPVALASALFPAIIRAKDVDEAAYRRRLQQLYGLFAWMAIAVAVALAFLSGPLIGTLYSDQFSEAASVLVVHVWTAPFLFMGVIFSKWLIVEGLLMTSLIRHGFGAVLNIVLNLILIPKHGPIGSAVATLVSYVAATYGACFLTRRTWPAAVDMTVGLLYPFVLAARALGAGPRPSTVGER